MKMTVPAIIILAVLLLCVVPVCATMSFVDDNSNASITSVNTNTYFRAVFDTVTNGTSEPNPGYILDSFYVVTYKQIPETGVFIVDTAPASVVKSSSDGSVSDIPAGDVVNGVIYANTRVFDGISWTGYTLLKTPTEGVYRVNLYGYNSTHPMYDLGNATITVGKNAYDLANFGTWLDAVGGSGLRFIMGTLVMFIFACVPALLLKRVNNYVEVIMIVVGLGVCLLVGLFDLWVVMGLIILVVAAFVIAKGEGY